MSGRIEVRVRLETLRFAGCHGVFEQEVSVGNEFVVDMEVKYLSDLATMVSDDLNHTVSYADLYAVVKEQMAVRSALLEAVAARILHCVETRWPQVIEAKVKIRKVRVPISGIDGSASVELSMVR